jgi:[NiFe] hydrogenase diaphorase moiety small subunit
MEVESETDDIRALRVAVLQMLFVEGNHVCPACEKSGNCQLQAVAYHCGMLEPHFPHFFPRRPVDASHPDVILDFNRCILCELCVRASRDHDGKRFFAVSGRGIDSRLIVDSPSGRLGDSRLQRTDKAPMSARSAPSCRGSGFAVPIGERRLRPRADQPAGDVAPAPDRADPRHRPEGKP